VVWFGELLPEDALIRAREATMRCDLFLSIGTSGQVEPAASLPRLAYNRGAVLAVINLDVDDRVQGHYYAIHARSGEFLPRLLVATWPESA
jgi:NAD-dependent deacetylase